jgi:uncharacterized membrane protein
MMELGPNVGFFILFTIFLSLAIPIAILWLVIVSVRNVAGRPTGLRPDPAADALRYRFGRGEISQAQFEDAMRALGYEKRP